ncbi:MAG: hypothetical protein IAF94_18945 [Pirellulaceae bacterium]|nr:hypothetical protein [Pirellulaceae bacterium]
MSQPLSDFRPQSVAGAPQPPASEPAPRAINPYESPDLEEIQENQEPELPEISPLESQIAVLLQRGKTGANWAYSIAGFSLINSLIVLVGGGTFFIIGLGVTLIADFGAVEAARQTPEKAVLFKGMAFAFDLFVAVVVCGFGWMAGKRYQAVFLLGMALYLLDGLLFLMFGQLMAVAFHAYGLYCMWSGFQAYRQLAVLERQLMDPLHPMGEFNPHQTVPTDVT